MLCNQSTNRTNDRIKDNMKHNISTVKLVEMKRKSFEACTELMKENHNRNYFLNLRFHAKL